MTRGLDAMASLRLTAVLLLALTAVLLGDYLRPGQPAWWSSVPLTGLVLNLAAALLRRPALRRDAALAAFHIALLAVLVCTVLGQLHMFDGQIELATGGAQDASAIEVREAGPLYPDDALADLLLFQEGFEVDYTPGLTRGETRSSLRLGRTGDALAASHVGDIVPARFAGHRFYTTSNKGFTAQLRWQPDAAAAVDGNVHFPSYPLHDWNQVQTWRTPHGESVHMELRLGQPVASGQAWTLRSDGAARASLVVTVNGEQQVLAAGKALRLRGGSLQLTGFGAWMGYRIAYDPYLDALLLFSLAGTLALAAYLYRRRQPSPAGQQAGARPAHV